MCDNDYVRASVSDRSLLPVQGLHAPFRTAVPLHILRGVFLGQTVQRLLHFQCDDPLGSSVLPLRGAASRLESRQFHRAGSELSGVADKDTFET